MDKIFKSFHYVSYLQYPFLIIGLFYSYKPLVMGIDNFSKSELISNYNLVLIFLGIALSFLSLTDATKRTKLGNKVFGKRKNVKIWLTIILIFILLTFTAAILIMFFVNDEKLKDFSVGIFVLGLGMIGILRMNLEIIKTYQPDWIKSTTANIG